MKKAIVLAFVILYVNAKSQSINHLGLFPTIDHSGQLSNRWSYGLYYFNAFNTASQKVNGVTDNSGYFLFYAEQSLSYQLNPKLSFTGSFVYQRQNPVDKGEYTNENRFYIQSTYRPTIGNSQLKFRLRYDGRFVQNPETHDRPYTSRVRTLLGFSRSLSDRLYVNAYNEFFFNTDNNAPIVYGENWAYAAIGVKTKRMGSWEAGPLYMAWINNSPNATLNFYYLQITWISHLDFRKTKIEK